MNVRQLRKILAGIDDQEKHIMLEMEYPGNKSEIIDNLRVVYALTGVLYLSTKDWGGSGYINFEGKGG